MKIIILPYILILIIGSLMDINKDFSQSSVMNDLINQDLCAAQLDEIHILSSTNIPL